MRTRTKPSTIVTGASQNLTASGRYIWSSFLGWHYVTPLMAIKHELKTDIFSGLTFPSYIGTSFGPMQDMAIGFGGYNECHQSKTEWYFPTSPVLVTSSGTAFGKPFTVTTTGSSAANRFSVNTSQPHSLVSPTTMRDRAINKIDFGFQSADVNLPQFLYELKDFSSLFKKVMEHLRPSNGRSPLWRLDERQNLISDALGQLGRQLRKENFIGSQKGSKPRKGKVTRRDFIAAFDVLQLLAGADLYNQFVLQPFIADVQALMDAGRQLAHEMDRIQNNSTVFRKREVDTYSTTVVNETGYRAFHTTSYSFHRTVSVCYDISYDFSNIKKPGELIALADILGFDQPITTIWESLPWSFLIDYFIKVGDFLKQFEGQLVDLPYTVNRSGWSCKTITTATVSTKLFGGSDLKGFTTSPEIPRVGYYTHTAYDRYPGPLVTPIFVPPRITLPNLRQIGNIVDLVILGLRPADWTSRG